MFCCSHGGQCFLLTTQLQNQFGVRLQNDLADNITILEDLYLGFKILTYNRALWYEVGSAPGVDCRCVHYYFIVYQVAQSASRDFPWFILFSLDKQDYCTIMTASLHLFWCFFIIIFIKLSLFLLFCILSLQAPAVQRLRKTVTLGT